MKTESFWDHLDTLRVALIKSLIAIGCIFALTLNFYPTLFAYLSPPSGFREAIHYERLKNNRDELLVYTLKPMETVITLSPTTIIDQQTLRIPPEGYAVIEKTIPADQLFLLSPTEGFIALIKVSLWTALALSSPFWGYFLLEFLAPGLEGQEKRLLFPFLGLSLLFLFSGALFAYQITLPLANAYLSAINEGIGQNLWSLSAYLDYSLLLLLANAIVFETGLIFLFLVHLGICTAPFMEQKRRGVIVAIFILSALLTPPDVLTQILMAVPLMILYESAIFYARFRSPPLLNHKSIN